jgi:alpha-D-ribose 1-methylphosphonate 5-triphosphate synthase subunit PhnI
VDRALRANELSELVTSPAQDEEFVLAHSDNVEASGFVQHLKLPHYVDFQSELVTVRLLRTEALQRQAEAEATPLSQAAE